VITLAIRTPLAKGFKGGFKDTELDYLIYSLLKKVIEKSKIDPQLVEDICCGNVCPGVPSSLPDLPRLSANAFIFRYPTAKLRTSSELLLSQLASQIPPPPPRSTDSAPLVSRLHKTSRTKLLPAASISALPWAQN
jgi:Thiolase, N-terminal domain